MSSFITKISDYLTKIWSDAQMAHFAFGLWPVLALRLWGHSRGFSCGVSAAIGAFFLFGFKILFPKLDQDSARYNLISFAAWMLGVGTAYLVSL